MSSTDWESRRHLLAALGALSLFSLLKLPFRRSRPKTISCGPSAKPAETKKLLGQDGRLVEVDASRITMLKRKITDQELKDWVKRSS